MGISTDLEKLVVVSSPLNNISQLGLFPIWKNKKCSKPPTRKGFLDFPVFDTLQLLPNQPNATWFLQRIRVSPNIGVFVFHEKHGETMEKRCFGIMLIGILRYFGKHQFSTILLSLNSHQLQYFHRKLMIRWQTPCHKPSPSHHHKW